MPVTTPSSSTANALIRYGFRIRSRKGVVLEKLLIMGRSADEASQKLYQMYPGCEVLSTWQEIPGRPGSPLNHQTPKVSFEDIADLINNL